MPLAKRHALVTGSTSGIGLAIARALAKEGADVMINGFGDKAAIEAERVKIEKDFGVKAFYHGADMAKAPEIEAMVDDAKNQDGIGRHPGQQRRHPACLADRGLSDRQVGRDHRHQPHPPPFHAIRAAIPGMKAQKWGRIINTASAHSLVASPFKSAYVAAKHGLAGLTKTVALELATSGVTANCISPGYVWTPLVERQIPDTMKARNMTREQVINDVMLAAQPTKQFVDRRSGRGARGLSLLGRRRLRSPAPTSRSTAAGPPRERRPPDERSRPRPRVCAIGDPALPCSSERDNGFSTT